MKRINIKITKSNEMLLSDCILEISASSADVDLRDDSFEFLWKVDDRSLIGCNGRTCLFTETVKKTTHFTVSVIVSSESYFGMASTLVKVIPCPFRNPLESNFKFSTIPVLNRGASDLIDPGAVQYYEGQFLSFYNSIFDFSRIMEEANYVGLAVSNDGIIWQRPGNRETPVLNQKELGDILGSKPTNLHFKTVLIGEDAWTVYFTVAHAHENLFYGDIYRGVATGPFKKWVIDPEPVLRADQDWENGFIGMPEVFKTESGFVMFYVSAGQDVGSAVSKDGINWIKRQGPLLHAVRPCYVQTGWGWIMLAHGKIYLSIDGINFHRYKENLFSHKEMMDRRFSIIWTSDALVHNDRVFYFLEGGNYIDENAESDVYLASWDFSA